MSLTLTCEHGQLARSCNICELETELTRLRAANRVLREALENIMQHKELIGGDMGRMTVTHRIAREALEKTKETKPTIDSDFADSIRETCERGEKP